jgi:DNA polymerase-3 subunit delta'
MDFLSADALPWLRQRQRQWRDSLTAGRLPHSTLLLSTPGLGAERLANWMAALALCEAPGVVSPGDVAPGEMSPCGICGSCALLRADTHPDYHPVRLEEDAKQIKVDQVRELIDSLTLKSYRGGYKVGVIEGAEALNTNGANAFLKTLEEPSAHTMLVMIARPTHRLPATIASRCLRMTLQPPATAAATAWLRAQGPAEQQWAAALDLAGGAPLLALELQQSGIAALEATMQNDIKALSAGAVDVTLLADQWVRSNLPLRITWLENWITRRVHTQFGGENSGQSAERVRLPAALLKANIKALFELLDAIRELRRLASTGMNQQLALEAMLLGSRGALAL